MGIIYRCLIVDDETPAHKALASHLSKFEDMEHTASAYNGMEALKLLNEQQFDIIFLDINMPVISGIELMELQPNRPLTIVTTAYSDFALSAYQHDAIDYLLKPISLEKFTKAIEKAKAYYSGYAIMKDAVTKAGALSCKVNGKAEEIPLADIMYIESIGNYLKLYRTKAKAPVILYGTLLSIVQDINNPDFVQLHRSYIVNKAFINTVTQNYIALQNNVQLPVGRTYKILLANLK